MHSLPYIVSGMKVRSSNKSSHENLLIKICKKNGYLLPLEYLIHKNMLLCDSTVGLKNKAP